MHPAEFKSILSAFVLPPAGPLVLALLGLALAATRWRRTGLSVACAGVVLGLALSTNAVGLWLMNTLLDQPPAVQPAQLEGRGVQAIVVLGGGVLPEAPEYGAAQPASETLTRIRYGAWLARRTGIPLGFAGGVGWSATGTKVASEGEVVRRVLQEDFHVVPRWVDDRSRDTQENAEFMAVLLRRDGVRRIALVTESWHMQRAAGHFRAQGLEVLPAPTEFPSWRGRALLEWLPSAHGAWVCRQAVREWLGLKLVPPRAPPGGAP